MTPALPQELIKWAVSTAQYLSPFMARVGEDLYSHSLATSLMTAALVTYPIGSLIGAGREDWFMKAAALSAIAGLLHDIGKALPEYQAYLRGERADAGIRHEVASFIIAANAVEELRRPGRTAWAAVLGSILYHHHGLYDITDNIVNYLHTGRKAWTRSSCSEDLMKAAESIARIIPSLNRLLDATDLSNYLRVRECAADPSLWCRGIRSLAGSEVMERAIHAEKFINRSRGVVVPLLSNLMIADNVAAYCALKSGAGDKESPRIRRVTEHSLYPIILRKSVIVNAFESADFPQLAQCVRGLRIGVRRSE